MDERRVIKIYGGQLGAVLTGLLVEGAITEHVK